MTKIINGKNYKVTRGGCWDCAFNRVKGENECCAYTEKVGGVIQFMCKLKFGERYEEVKNDKNH